jgi:hypothetical protein
MDSSELMVFWSMVSEFSTMKQMCMACVIERNDIKIVEIILFGEVGSLKMPPNF